MSVLITEGAGETADDRGQVGDVGRPATNDNRAAFSDLTSVIRPQASVLHHAVYVIGENPVTGFAFALFLLIIVCAIFGPLVAPYDPLARDTAAAYQSPSTAHWFGTDQLGRDIMSRVITATRLDLAIAVFSVALVLLLGGVSGVMADRKSVV